MNEFERRIKELFGRITDLLGSQFKTVKRKERRAAGAAFLRHEANKRAHRAATRVQEFRQSDRGHRAESALHDLRDSQPAKHAEAVFNDLRESDIGKKAETALADLRQREPVKKAEENARKVLHDLFSGAPGAPGDSGAAGGESAPGTSSSAGGSPAS